MTDNIIDRDNLQDIYINKIIDSMTREELEAFVYDVYDSDLDQYNMNELITEVESTYPELLDGAIV